MTAFLLLAIAAATAGNAALARLAGVPQVLATVDQPDPASRPAVAAGIAVALAIVACFALERGLLAPAGLLPLRLAGYAGIAWLAVRVGAAVAAAGRALPVAATTGTVLAVALLVVPGTPGLSAAVATGLGAGTGYAGLLVLFAALGPRLARAPAPAALRGTPLRVATFALLSLAVVGFTGVGS